MLKELIDFVKVISSETNPWQIAFAIAFAMIVGFTPFWSLHNLLIFLLVFMLRVNIGSFFIFIAIFTSLAFLLDPLFHDLGYKLLTQPGLKAFWTDLYNIHLFRLERINNTILLGSLSVSLLLFFPVAWASKILIIQYREAVLAKLGKSRIMVILRSTRIFRLLKGASSL